MAVGGFEPPRQIGHRLLIQRGLLAAQGAVSLHLGLVGKVGDDALVGLQSPEDVGPHQIAQRAVRVVLTLLQLLDETGELFPPRPAGPD